MDEQRIVDYLNLIKKLLTCPNKEAVKLIFNRSSELVDEEFVITCQLVSEILRLQGQENQADFLINLAEQLAEYLNMTEDGKKQASQSNYSEEDYQKFLQQLIQIETESRFDQKIVHQFLAQHRNKLDLNFAKIIIRWFNSEINPNNYWYNKYYLATMLNAIARHIQYLSGERINNIEIAITCYENALNFYTKDSFPKEWADIQNNLAVAYRNRIKEAKDDNVDKAIKHYENALTVYTQDSYEWAMTQNNLGVAYGNRINGKKADNVDKAIKHYENALNFYTKDSFPEEWAGTQNNLGNDYRNRINGVKEDNLEKAINYSVSSLKVYTYDTFPDKWSETQNSLGNAYFERIKGEKADNLDKAIQHYQNALTVRNKDHLPEEWAITQHNLGLAYSDRTNGSRTDNLEKAIKHYENALIFRTRNAFPEGNTQTLMNLGFTYKKQSSLYNNDYTKKQIALENAFNTFKEALEVLEYVRGDVTNAEAKNKLNEEWNGLYQGMVEVCLELGKKQEAIEYVDRSKARNLVELIAIRGVYPETNDIPSDVRQRLQELRNLIADENRRLQQDAQLNYSYINELRQEYQEKFPYKPLTFDEMQKLLDEKTAILEWYILPDKLLTFIITTKSLKLQVFTEKDLAELINFGNEYLKAYFDEKDHNSQWGNALATRMEKLSNILHLPQLLDSAFKELPQCEKLILMPHRGLHLFPIHALPLMHNGKNKPLQEYFSQGVSYAPNCQLLQQAQKRQYSQFDRLFAIQNPTNDLSGADLEVESIQNIFRPNKRSSLQRGNATKTNFLNKDLSQVHHLYFACHGSSNIKEPLKSGLRLADEVLTLEEIISKLKLSQCSLVTLSACETGQVGIDETDEYISLASGFILAGASNVLMTLWSVNDLSTVFLLIKSYEYLKDQLQAKKPIQLSIILRDAQNWLRNITIAELKIWVNNSKLINNDNRAMIINYFKNDKNFGNISEEHGENYCLYASPFHWAAFCIVGQAELKYFK